jgi:hypothetical protein
MKVFFSNPILLLAVLDHVSKMQKEVPLQKSFLMIHRIKRKPKIVICYLIPLNGSIMQEKLFESF